MKHLKDALAALVLFAVLCILCGWLLSDMMCEVHEVREYRQPVTLNIPAAKEK